MRLKAPQVPRAASANFGAAIGPRLLPGTYTVRMTKDKQVYTSELRVVPDPRSKHTAEDRRAQFDLAMKLYDLLGNMTYSVERINNVRLALEERAAKLPATDPLAVRLRAASAAVDDLRRKIVATKEGGAITGEERLRENLADLYANVNGYEGRPAATQVARSEVLARELGDVEKDFDAWLTRELAAINAELARKKLEPIKELTRAEFDAKTAK